MESLIVLPPQVDKLLVPIPTLVKAQVVGPHEERQVWFETSREGVTDREGQDIAANALWNSRKLFLEQGSFDLNHWSFLGNPPGTGMRPEYIVGRPSEVRHDGPRCSPSCSRGKSRAASTTWPRASLSAASPRSITARPPCAWAAR